jgi:hypothetical protein
VLSLVALVAFAGAFPAPAAQEGGGFKEVTECQKCHTSASRYADALNFVLLTEYATWKLEDKHAQAYAVLKGERAKQMGKLLGVNVTEAAGGCLNCHAMANFKNQDQEYTNDDGVSCAGCHGPSDAWVKEHAFPEWRKHTAQEKEKYGMYNVRDPARRAELCMSCHVGDAAQGRVVTHEMFAAGHPPLPPFDLELFSRNLPQHWRDPADVPFFRILAQVGELPPAKNRDDWAKAAIPVLMRNSLPRPAQPNKAEQNKFVNLYRTPEEARKVLGYYPAYAGAATFRTQLSLTGSLSALRETMLLVADRAGPPPPQVKPEWVWPELARNQAGAKGLAALAAERWPEVALAHTDCYSCHHDLRTDSFRQLRGYGYRLPGGKTYALNPSSPPIRQWSLAVLGPNLKALLPRNEAATGLSQLEKDLDTLAGLGRARPFGPPQEMGKAARDMAAHCDALLQKSQGAVPGDSLRAFLIDLCRLNQDMLLDFESARQVAAVLQTAFDDLYPGDGGPRRARDVLRGLEQDLNLKPYASRMERRKLMQELLAKAVGEDVEGASEFWKSVEHPNDGKLLLKLRDNKVLRALEQSNANDDLNKGMLDAIGRLEALSDAELKVELTKLADFKPERFKDQMRDLGDALRRE